MSYYYSAVRKVKSWSAILKVSTTVPGPPHLIPYLAPPFSKCTLKIRIINGVYNLLTG